MNRDDIIRMAREACGEPAWSGGVEWTWEEVERFTNLVAAAEREWQGLTMEELDALVEEHSGWPVEMVGHVLICAAEDKLKGKNT